MHSYPADADTLSGRSRPRDAKERVTTIRPSNESRGNGVLRSSHGVLARGIMPVGKGSDTRRHRVMRVFVMVEPKFFTPPEMFPTLLEGFAAWRDANREHMESFEAFAGGGGGFGIFDG